MSQIITKGIATNAVIDTKIRLSNEGWLKSRNAADTADVNILKLDANNETVFASQATRFTGNVIIGNGQYLQARNQADTADVGLLRLTSANEVEFGKSDNVSFLIGSRVDTLSGGQINFYAGNAQVNILPNGAGAPAIRWHDNDASNYVGLKAPATVTSSFIWTMMPADGTNGQAVVTDGAGNLSFATVSGGSGANQQLSNLSGTVAINLSLLPGVTNTIDVGSATKQFANGHIRILNVNNIQAIDGALTLNAKGFGLSAYTQDETGATNSAALLFKSGDVVNGQSGDVTARVGVATGSGTRGRMIVEMRHMHIYGEVADQGNEQINLGQIGGETASTGFVVQTAIGTSGNNSQALNLGSGNADGNSGGLNLSTGVAGTNGGAISLTPGPGATPDQNGQVFINCDRTLFSAGQVVGLPVSAVNPATLTTYVAGDTYYNSTLNKPKYFNGTTWEYFDGGTSLTWGKEYVTLSGTDITNQYFDLAQEARLNSVSAFAKGQPMGIEDAAEDYTLSYTGGVAGVTRVNFVTNWATAGVSELVAGDILVFQYQY